MTSVAVEASRWMCGGRPSDRSVRAHRIGGGVRILGPAAQAAGSVAGDRWNCKRCNGRGDAVRLPARGFFEGYEPASRGSHRVRASRIRPVKRAAIDRNTTNPRIGSRLQYACDFRGR